MDNHPEFLMQMEDKNLKLYETFANRIIEEIIIDYYLRDNQLGIQLVRNLIRDCLIISYTPDEINDFGDKNLPDVKTIIMKAMSGLSDQHFSAGDKESLEGNLAQFNLDKGKLPVATVLKDLSIIGSPLMARFHQVVIGQAVLKPVGRALAKTSF